MTNIWTCKVGTSDNVPAGGDLPMRLAVEAAFKQLTGDDPEFNFSGWAGKLTEVERAVVQDRLPDPFIQRSELREQLQLIDAECDRIAHANDP